MNGQAEAKNNYEFDKYAKDMEELDRLKERYISHSQKRQSSLEPQTIKAANIEGHIEEIIEEPSGDINA